MLGQSRAMAGPPHPDERKLIVLCGAFGAVISFMGGAACIFVLRGGHVRYRGTYLSTLDSALIALFLLALGLVLLRVAIRLANPSSGD